MPLDVLWQKLERFDVFIIEVTFSYFLIFICFVILGAVF